MLRPADPDRYRAAGLAALALAAVLGAAASVAARPPYAGDPPSPVIYPAERIPLVFDHAAHLRRGATCADCHAAAATSRSAVDDLIPGEAACRACHPIDRADPERAVAGAPPARCDACHVGFVAGQPPARVVVPPPNLKFDHAAHLGRGLACADCHGDLEAEGVALATRDQLPRMRLCLTCHDGGRAPGACATCHLAEVGVLRTTFPEGTLAPSGVLHGDAHGVDFVLHHGAAASRDRAYCGACHRERECRDCHTGVVKPLAFHPADYALAHAVDARRGRPDCSACHRQQTFCVGCHDRAGVGTRAGDLDADDPRRRFHPADWVSLAGGGNRHAREARANLNACASCHREDDCRACHTAEPGGPRVSPHGPGWRRSARCEALAAKNPRLCLRCHVDVVTPSCD